MIAGPEATSQKYDTNIPANPQAAPKTSEITVSRPKESVSNRAAVGGMTIAAAMRVTPTTFVQTTMVAASPRANAASTQRAGTLWTRTTSDSRETRTKASQRAPAARQEPDEPRVRGSPAAADLPEALVEEGLEVRQRRLLPGQEQEADHQAEDRRENADDQV